jgi:PilZ domain
MTKANRQMNEPRYKDRVHPRCDLKLKTQLELDDGRAVDFQMSNISQSGFGGHSIEQAPIGSEVEVVLPTIGPRPAQVVWQIGTSIGARLASELSVQQILAVALETMKTTGQSEGTEGVVAASKT